LGEKQYYILFISASSSSCPSSLALTCTGNAFFIADHLFSLTNSLFLAALRAQVEIRVRHIGQQKFASSTFCWKQSKHNSCLHGIVTGCTNMYRQIGQILSSNFMVVAENKWREIYLFLFGRNRKFYTGTQLFSQIG